MQEACRYAIIRYGAQRTNYYAPVAQWIEHRPPEPCAVVRFHSGVPQSKTDVDFVLRLFYFLGAVKPCVFGCNAGAIVIFPYKK